MICLRKMVVVGMALICLFLNGEVHAEKDHRHFLSKFFVGLWQGVNDEDLTTEGPGDGDGSIINLSIRSSNNDSFIVTANDSFSTICNDDPTSPKRTGLFAFVNAAILDDNGFLKAAETKLTCFNGFELPSVPITIEPLVRDNIIVVRIPGIELVLHRVGPTHKR